MRRVLDASAAVCWVLTGQHTPEAGRLRQAVRNQVHELVAPSILLEEVLR
jgi:hypothetical protein